MLEQVKKIRDISTSIDHLAGARHCIIIETAEGTLKEFCKQELEEAERVLESCILLYKDALKNYENDIEAGRQSTKLAEVRASKPKAVTTKTWNMIEALAEAFKAAGKAAGDAWQDDDGGTCNLDSPAFRVKGMKQTHIETAAEIAGYTVTGFTWFGGQRWFWLGVNLSGQGNRRAAMAGAAAKALEEYDGKIEGFSSCCYRQMD